VVTGRLAGVDVSAFAVGRFCAAEDFAGKGCDLADAEEQEPGEVPGGVAFDPFEVDVGSLSGGVADVHDEGGERVAGKRPATLRSYQDALRPVRSMFGHKPLQPAAGCTPPGC
jgi:hypothetical protein